MELSPEIKSQIIAAFTAKEPNRDFQGLKVLQESGNLIIRIYSYKKPFLNLIPVPYQVYSFEIASGNLRELLGSELEPFVIHNYK